MLALCDSLEAGKLSRGQSGSHGPQEEVLEPSAGHWEGSAQIKKLPALPEWGGVGGGTYSEESLSS